jgi:MFS family permease
MDATDVYPIRMADSEHRACLRRAVIASTVGTTIEWYDFLLYSIVTGLVFGKLYFPGTDPLVSTLQAFGVFFIGFAARPIGAVVFGHYGDRIGRKAALIVTLLITGIATAAVGLVPGYDTIGIWGGIILTLLRVAQGIGVGGEWGGSVLLAMEWAQTNKNRGFIASWPQFGAPAGTCLANIAILVFSWLSGDQFLSWGWRVPFLLGIVMVGVGLWIRLGIVETPVFQRMLAENKVERAPAIEVLRRQPREVVLTALLRLAEQSPGFRVRLWHDRSWSLSQSIAVGIDRRHCAWLHLGPHCRRPIRSRRSQADVHHWVRIRRGIRIRVFRAPGHENA